MYINVNAFWAHIIAQNYVEAFINIQYDNELFQNPRLPQNHFLDKCPK